MKKIYININKIGKLKRKVKEKKTWHNKIYNKYSTPFVYGDEKQVRKERLSYLPGLFLRNRMRKKSEKKLFWASYFTRLSPQMINKSGKKDFEPCCLFPSS